MQARATVALDAGPPADAFSCGAARAELAARAAALGLSVECRSPQSLAAELASLGMLAERHRIGPAVTIVRALEAALARSETAERCALVRGWLAVLRDAVGALPREHDD